MMTFYCVLGCLWGLFSVVDVFTSGDWKISLLISLVYFALYEIKKAQK